MESFLTEDSREGRSDLPARPPPDMSGIRILHVDDEPLYLEIVAGYLREEDERFTIVTETDAEDALRRLEEESIDCIVSDYQMPHMDGLTLLDAVRDRDPTMPFILLTGKGSEEIASEAISRGVTDYLQKQPAADQYRVLANRIVNVVSRRRAEKRYGSVLEAAPDSIVIVASDGTIRRVNRQAEELFGYDEEQLLGEPVEILIPDRFRDAHVGHRREYVEDPETRPMGADLDLFALTRDGEEIPVDISLSPMRVGDETEIVAAIRDISERKWREQELHEERALTDNIFAAMPEVLYMFDTEGTLLRWNDQVREVTGYSDDEIAEMHPLDFIPDDEKERVTEAIQTVLQTGEPTTIESAYETKEGERIPYEFSGGVFHDVDGEIKGIAGIGRDISERKERERELRRRTEAMEASIDGMAVLDDDHRYTYLNRAHAETYGYDAPEELLGESWRVLYHDEEIERFEEEIFPVLDEQGHWRGEAVGRRTDGSRFEQELSLTRLDDGGLVCVVRDTSDRKSRQRRYDAIFNQTYQFTGLLETDGTLIEANEAALEFGGLDREDVVGQKMWDTAWFRISEEVQEIARDAVERAREGEFVRSEIEVQGADRTAIIDFSVKPVTDETGEVVQLVPEGRDITELKHQQEALERQNQRLEEFTSVVAHDLRNPLTVLFGNLELLQGDLVDPRVDDALRAADRMETLIDDLLRLAREGRDVDEVETVRLGEIADRAWSMVETDGADIQIPARDAEISADPERLQDLLENLFRNAVQHGGDVTIRVDRLPDGPGFLIEDDGPGIPDELRDRVFEPGYSTEEGGTGFGLPIVKRVAEAHGWTVRVAEGPDDGARFEIVVDETTGP